MPIPDFGAGDAGFVLSLERAPDFSCIEIVRHVPGRRMVCRGVWNGQAVFAKIFIGADAERYAGRDARGARALVAAGIPTPSLLHEGNIAGGQGRCLVYAAIADGRQAEQVWRTADTMQRRLLALALVRVVARHHTAGLIQTDLYLRNFFCDNTNIYTLDGDGIRIHGGPLSLRRSMDNLALLLSKFDVEDDGHTAELLSAYAETRGWPTARADVDSLRRKVRGLRRRVAFKYAGRKVLRDCTDVLVEHDFSRFLAAARARQFPELLQVLDNPDALLDAPACQRLKNGNTCTVGLVQAGGRHVVIKRYNIKNFWHGLNRALRRTRASISWSNAHLLGVYDIATALPLALIEYRWGPLRRQSYFLAEYVDGPDIGEFFADAAVDEARKRQVAKLAAELLHKLYLLEVEHGDMKATNLKIVDGKPMLLDLDAMRQHHCGWWFRRRHARDLRRFLKNWHNAPEILRVLESALEEVYGDDPVLAMAGITNM